MEPLNRPYRNRQEANGESMIPVDRQPSDTLRTRIKQAIDQAHASTHPHSTYDDWLGFAADAVIRELGPIPDRTHTDDQGRTWEWCGGETGTWAWRITANGPVEVEVRCAVCQRIYHVRADSPGWSAVWTCCISCQANEENDWTADD